MLLSNNMEKMIISLKTYLGFLFIVLLTFLFVSSPVFSACTQSLNTQGIISDWVAKDKAYLNGRKKLYYYFEQESIEYILDIDGPVKVRSDPFYSEEVALGKALLNEVDNYIGLDFFQVKKRKDADFIILGVCVKETVLDGIVTTSLDGTKAIMTLNGCNTPFSSKHPPETLFLHELGHVLGLEHPFDDSDGDCIGSVDPWSQGSAHTGQTLMAYRDPPGNVRTFFTDLDILALQEIWGRN